MNSDQVLLPGGLEADEIRNRLQGGILKQILERIGFDADKFAPLRLTFSQTGTFQSQVNKMKEHLQAAVSLELTTIPLYLYAIYSVKEHGEATWSITDVVEQEMLHLALAGNLLCSIGGDPILYKAPTSTHKYVPEYPCLMPYQDITLNMKSATKSNFRTFMELERPEPGLNVDEAGIRDSNIYGSIGAFYQSIIQELDRLYASDDSLFKASTKNMQFNYGDGSWRGKNMIVITDIHSARNAIKTIIDQGEGSTGLPPLPKLPNTGRIQEPTPPVALKSHFEVFEDLYNGFILNYHTFFENPKTGTTVPPNENGVEVKEYKVLLACDAAYCYLLITIEKMWDLNFGVSKRHELVTNNLHHLMTSVLRPFAKFLTGQEYRGNRLAPFFNFYRFVNTSSCHDQLKVVVADAANAYPGESTLTKIKEVVDGLVAVNYRGWPDPLV